MAQAMGSMMGDQVGSGGANRRLGGAQRTYGTERDIVVSCRAAVFT